MTFAEGCGTDSMYWANVLLPPNAGAASYTLPSQEVTVEAEFYLPTMEPQLTTQFGSLKVTSGAITVESRSTLGIEADVDIEFDSTAGDHLSIVGHVVESNCTLEQSTYCDH
jgi:hypothetical protein